MERKGGGGGRNVYKEWNGTLSISVVEKEFIGALFSCEMR
jgi:hypothetical protein